MRNVIVIGAGIGGVYAAKKLAELGYQVTVIEARAREALGYPWFDSVNPDTFHDPDLHLPDDACIPKQVLNFYGPFGDGKIKQPDRVGKHLDVHREKLIRFLIESAEPLCTLLFEENVTDLIIEENTVKGVRTEKRTLFADLVIDASGLFSPFRRSTPDSFFLNDPLDPHDYIVAYREEYSRKECDVEPSPNVYIYPKDLMLAWCKPEPDKGGMDVLLGSYDGISDESKEAGLAFLREHNPCLGELISSRKACVALRYPMGVLSANGYVLVGDSAFMTFPFNGSGITIALKAAKLLVSVIKDLGDRPFTAENLWRYSRLFVRRIGASFAAQYVFRQVIEILPSEDLDFVFTSGLFDTGIVAIATMDRKHMRKVNVRAFFSGFRSTIKRKDIVRATRGSFSHAVRAYFLARSIPSKYDPKEVAEWKKKYDTLMRGAPEKVSKIYLAAKE